MPWCDSRWRKGFEGKGLTWGTEIDGRQVLDAFTNLGLSIKSNHVVLEVGPGYGRVFETFRGFFEFRKWYMVDINPDNCEFLIKKFGDDDRIKVLCQDVNQLELPEKFDLGISTLTFKHLYPDFSQALTRLRGYIKDDGTFLFDLIPPGEDRLIYEGVNIANFYSEQSLQTLIELSGFRIEAVGTVTYEGGRLRNLYRLSKTPQIQVEERERELMRRIASLERSMAISQEELFSLRSAFIARVPLSVTDVSKLVQIPSDTYFSIDYFDDKAVLASTSPIIIDSKTRKNHTVSGWAVDKEANDLAGGVFLTIDGQIDICAYYGLYRPDVSDSLGNPKFRFSGYNGILPSSILKKGSHALSVKIVTKDGRGYYCPTWKVDFLVD